MIDIHLHLLPGIDDGAVDLDESLAMCRLAAADGCTDLVATPHQRHDRWANRDRRRLEGLLEELGERLAEMAAEPEELAPPPPRLHLGAEIRVDSVLLDELERPEEHGVLSLAGSRWLLVELDRRGADLAGIAPEDLVHELAVAGWRPILAHPEFILGLGDDPDRVAELVELGATCQVTAMSVTGEFGRCVQQRVERLFDAGLVHFVASDGHSADHRPPGLGRARESIASRWGEDAARRLTVTHPRAVIEDRPLEEGPSRAHEGERARELAVCSPVAT